jgi:hypothetical protein
MGEEVVRYQEVVPLEAAIASGETHTVEFKRSLSLLDEAAQTVVAFASTNGGSLFFRVNDDGSVPGITLGKNTLEQLGADLDSHIYPYSPAAIDPVVHRSGKDGIRLSVWPDRPPVVGMYLFSDRQLDRDRPSRLDALQGYRRVGKSNRKAPDPMLLREPQPTDPVVMVALTGGSPHPTEISFVTWMPDLSGGFAIDVQAHVEQVALDPIVVARDFPSSDGVSRVNREIKIPLAQPGDRMVLVVSYSDEFGCGWESRLQITVGDDAGPVGGALTRRIAVLPPTARMP